jgi:N-acetylglutamate synthase-like GNAT family acetyltransferase
MSFLQELDIAVSRGSAESCQRALWYTTDLLITGRYTDDEIWMFGEVIGRLEQEIEVVARAQLARRLARIGNAPTKIIHKFAFDDSIDVAGPVLRRSERLDVRALVENVRTKSQQHLLAISKRKSIVEEVTDELVTRGDREVVSSAAANDGAHFSDFGILHMIKRSEGDSILVEHLGRRKDIPRHLFQQLIAKASDNTKKKIERERPEVATEIQTLVTDVTGTLHSKFGPASKSYFAVKKLLAKCHQDGALNEKRIFEYALSRKFEEVTVGLSLLCSLPVDVVERALIDKSKEVILILAKALGFSWETAMSLLFLAAPDHRIAAQDLDGLKNDFADLNVETSRSVLAAYRSRKHAASHAPERRLPQLYAR